MSETKKINILKDILGDYTISGNEFIFKCPFCDHHKKKLSINFNKGAAKCWICDWSTPNLGRIVRRLGTYVQIQEWNELCGIIEINDYSKIFESFEEVIEEKEEVIDLPEEFITLCTKNNHISSYPARRYLKDRGISSQDIKYWKMGYCISGKYENRIIIPSFNLDGNVNYFIARRYDDGGWSKYLNPKASKDIIFNELYLDWTEDIIIVEGVFDAIKAKNAIPILGSTLRENSRLFKQIVKNDPAIYIALDPDAEKKAEKLIKSLLNYDIELYKINVPSGIDIGDMSHEDFLSLKKSAELIKNTDYLLLNKIMGI